MATGTIQGIYDFTNGVPIKKTFVPASTTHTIDFPSTSSHLIMMASSSGTSNAIFYVHRASTGNASVTEIMKGSSVSISVSGSVVTITLASSQSEYISDFVLRGTTFAGVTS